ncbi:hypothetical protein JCM11641_000259 [Rhodosporidiobolus odoratus]
MDDDDQLADPEAMSPQERVDQLCQAVEAGDLLTVLVVTTYTGEQEINLPASTTGWRPLEAAVLANKIPTRIGTLVLECLLLRSADPAHALDLAQTTGSLEAVKLLGEWQHGGYERAEKARQLCAMDWSDAETEIDALVEEYAVLEAGDLAAQPPQSPTLVKMEEDFVAKPEEAEIAPYLATPSMQPEQLFKPEDGHPGPDPPAAPPHAASAASSAAMHTSASPREKSRQSFLSTSVPPLHDPQPRQTKVLSSPAASYGDRPYRRSSRSRSPRRRPASPSSTLPCRPTRESSPLHRNERWGYPGRSPSPPRLPRLFINTRPPAVPPSPSSWIHVTGIPSSVSERWIYETLHRQAISAEDIHLTENQNMSTRSACVGLRTVGAANDAIDILRHAKVDNKRLSAQAFLTSDGNKQPRFKELSRLAYLGPHRNAERCTTSRSRELIFEHLKIGISARQLAAFVEKRIGRGVIQHCQMLPASKGMAQSARATLHAAADIERVIIEMDGAVWNAVAMGVWQIDPPAHTDTASNAPRSTPSAPHQQETNPTRLSASSPVSSASAKPASRLPILQHSPPAPPPRPASPSLEIDLARLRSLALPPSTFNDIQQIWKPVDHPPSASASDSPPLTRRLQVEVDFGFLDRREAKLALDANAEKPVYPDDPGMQQRYETFLKAQAGESRDWYTVFLAKLTEFSRATATFVEKGRQAAASSAT